MIPLFDPSNGLLRTQKALKTLILPRSVIENVVMGNYHYLRCACPQGPMQDHQQRFAVELFLG